ncbi:MAG TPA: FoF1 ATP synthase subunit a [Candidatus Limnocylindrales bacterium]|nr:FoF1 ATP synthase subunit a [Candidatus Limnocylindrales bacterium]
MSSEQDMTPGAAEAPAPEPEPTSGRGLSQRWFLFIGAIIVLNIVALILVPPFPKEGGSGDPCPYPVCFINGTLEFPAPETLVSLTSAPAPDPSQLIVFYPSISNTILTQWLVIVVVLAGAILLTRGRRLVPGRGQNVFEMFYEFLTDFGVGIAGAAAKPYLGLFVSFFLLIIFSNWIGLAPGVGRVPWLRAPSSDVNITLGLALVSFAIFEGEGFRKLGFRGYLGKFFPLYEFRTGIAAGFIAMFVGLVELMLEFVKPVTLSMRLFGNIYGGEVALSVITGLTLALIPVGLLGLDFLLNAIQALIFSILTLVFITLAIESHDHEEGHVAEEAVDTLEGHEPPALQPAH